MKNFLNQFCFAFILFVLSFSVFAQSKDILEPNQVSFDVKAEEWVATKAADVTISVDATLDKLNSVEMREQIVKQLAEISNNNIWNITVFNVSQNDSGLDQLHVEAESRLNEALLTDLNVKVKALTKPGLTFRVISVDFTPSLAELEAAKADLRSKLYKEALAETARINAIYPDKKYFVHSLIINSMETPPIMPLNRSALFAVGGAPFPYAANVAHVAEVKSGNAPMLSVSTKIQMTASIGLASTM